MVTKLSEDQVNAINIAGIDIDKGRAQELLELLEDDTELWAFSIEDLETTIQIANATYRAGVPVMSDAKYDAVCILSLIHI